MPGRKLPCPPGDAEGACAAKFARLQPAEQILAKLLGVMQHPVLKALWNTQAEATPAFRLSQRSQAGPILEGQRLSCWAAALVLLPFT